MLRGTTSVYRRRLTIDHSRVGNTDQHEFLLLVRVGDPTLRFEGGHVAQSGGTDVFFTLADGTTRVPHELIRYNAEAGQVEAWVKVPKLSCRQDGVLYLYYGGPAVKKAFPPGRRPGQDPNTKEIWGGAYKLVAHGDTSSMTAGGNRLEGAEALTVEAWVEGEAGAEILQPLVSKWAVLESFDRFSAYDAGDTDGLEAIGYLGGAFDGRYIYWAPNRRTSQRESVHGVVLRCDTQGDFSEPQSWAAFDVEAVTGLRTVNYYGAVFDGRYVYFVPQDEGTAYHSRVLRYDAHGDFKDAASWQAYDVGLLHSYQGAAFDGRYIYFCPGYEGTPGAEVIVEEKHSSKVVRLDTRGGFKDPISWQVFDVGGIAEGAACFDGGAFDRRYIYFVPLCNGMVLRYDTSGDFSDQDSWESYDVKGLIGGGWCVGSVFDGRYLYLVPYMHGVVVRFDTWGGFVADSAWAAFDASQTDGLDTSGADGGFFDGRYVYFIPWAGRFKKGGSGHHANFLRYDTQRPFGEAQSWSACDASTADGLQTIGYNGGMFDGRFFYGAPLCDDERFHGKVLRYDTVGEKASFSLRYCDYGHNGGLSAAVPGPSFVVNTDRGALSVAAHQSLEPGWHYLAGVYDGASLKLFVDGQVVAQRSGQGKVQSNLVATTIGGLANGTARFLGRVWEARVATVVRDEGWLKTAYQNLVDPAGFVHLGAEERVELPAE